MTDGTYYARSSQPKTLAQVRADTTLWLSAAKVAVALYGLLGVIGGIVLCAHTVDSGSYSDPVHPFAGFGVASIVWSILSAVVGYAVVAYLAWRVAEAQS